MKNSPITFLLLLSLLANHAFAQPGDSNLEHRLRWFNETQDSVIENPERLCFRWARLDILFNPYFEIQTRPTNDLKAYLTTSSQFYQYVADSLVERIQPCDMCRFTSRRKYNPASKLGAFLLSNQEQLIADLTQLIDSDLSFRSSNLRLMAPYVKNPNKADFLHRRGQFYYFTGRKERGLADFLAALKYAPSERLEKQIYTSLAAYYYTIENAASQENYQQTLKFMQLVEPALEDSSHCKGERPRDYLYEREKLDLMRRYDDSTSLVNYLQNRAAGFLNYSYALMKSTTPKDHYGPSHEKAFFRSREYELMIYDYLKEANPKTRAEALKAHKKRIVDKL